MYKNHITPCIKNEMENLVLKMRKTQLILFYIIFFLVFALTGFCSVAFPALIKLGML